MPDWAKTGPITLKNYGYRAEKHCCDQAAARDHQHPTIKRPSPEFSMWREYFERHLGGLPSQMVALLTHEPGAREMTVPEREPQWFDPSFEPDPRWVEREYVQMGSRPIARAPIPEGQDYDSMVRRHGVPVEPGSEPRPEVLGGRSKYSDEDLRRLYARQQGEAAE